MNESEPLNQTPLSPENIIITGANGICLQRQISLYQKILHVIQNENRENNITSMEIFGVLDTIHFTLHTKGQEQSDGNPKHPTITQP